VLYSPLAVISKLVFYGTVSNVAEAMVPGIRVRSPWSGAPRWVDHWAGVGLRRSPGAALVVPAVWSSSR